MKRSILVTAIASVLFTVTSVQAQHTASVVCSTVDAQRRAHLVSDEAACIDQYLDYVQQTPEMPADASLMQLAHRPAMCTAGTGSARAPKPFSCAVECWRGWQAVGGAIFPQTKFPPTVRVTGHGTSGNSHVVSGTNSGYQFAFNHYVTCQP